MSFKDQIDKSKIPAHIAIIMDGNGRWAKSKQLDRTEGHRRGVESVRTAMKAASEIGVKYLTLYTFSTENWNRPAAEVDALMELMVQAVARETAELVENGIVLKVIGEIDRLPAKTRQALEQCLEATSKGTSSTVILALSYSSKWEITNAVRKIAEEVKAGKIDASDINETLVSEYLATKDFPDPDMLIRTGGEHRISNFLMWQIAYSELYFSDELWPDFSHESLYKAVVDFQHRERRFGKTSEQVAKK